MRGGRARRDCRRELKSVRASIWDWRVVSRVGAGVGDDVGAGAGAVVGTRDDVDAGAEVGSGASGAGADVDAAGSVVD